MHTIRQLVESGIDGHSTMRQADSAPRSTPIVPIIPAVPAIPLISPIDARIGRAKRPTNATTTRATLRIPRERTGPG